MCLMDAITVNRNKMCADVEPAPRAPPMYLHGNNERARQSQGPGFSCLNSVLGSKKAPNKYVRN